MTTQEIQEFAQYINKLFQDGEKLKAELCIHMIRTVMQNVKCDNFNYQQFLNDCNM